MDDLISRKAAIEALGERPENWMDTQAEIEAVRAYDNAIDNLKAVPSIPAVPLDKLCEWMENDCILSCVSCEHLFGGQWCKQHPELPYRCNRKEHWKEVLTKRMEGLDAK